MIFSGGMFLADALTKLVLCAAEQKQIRQILLEGLSADQRFERALIKHDRERVVKILQPHFSASGIKAIPLVVEEMLEGAQDIQRRHEDMRRNLGIIYG